MILTIDGVLNTSLTLLKRYKLLRGGALFLLHAYIGTLILSLTSLCRLRRLPKQGERRLFYASLIASPILALRLIYPVAAVFEKNKLFRFVLGNWRVFLGMAVLEEWVVTIICVGVGVWTAKSIGSGLVGEKEDGEREVKSEGFLPPVAPIFV
jgi:hypothetical protein